MSTKIECPECHGRGRRRPNPMLHPGQRQMETCPACDGSGQRTYTPATPVAPAPAVRRGPLSPDTQTALSAATDPRGVGAGAPSGTAATVTAMRGRQRMTSYLGYGGDEIYADGDVALMSARESIEIATRYPHVARLLGFLPERGCVECHHPDRAACADEDCDCPTCGGAMR